MPAATIYLNLEDDVSKIVARIKRVSAEKVVLVCPKRCFLFSDSINLRLLKKQADLLGKQVAILTMDERGQMYAKEAGFGLKMLSTPGRTGKVSDINRQVSAPVPAQPKSSIKVTRTAPAFGNIVRQVKRAVIPTRDTNVSPAVVSTPPAAKMENIQVYDTVFPAELQQVGRSRFSVQKALGWFVALALIIVLLLVFVVLPKASVVVYPAAEPIARDMDITLSVAAQQPDPAGLVLPAVKVDQTDDVNNQFQSQGKQEVGNVASGMVQMYNFTKLPLNLKASTTVLSIGGNSYLLAADDMGIKPTTYSNQQTKEVNPASLSAPVEVVAASGGDEFNVPAGTRLEISNQVFGSKPQVLFAKSATAITGGTSRFLSVVAPGDISNAQSALNDQFINQINSNLQSQNLLLIPKNYVIQTLSFTTDKPAGTESPTFEADLKAEAIGLAFNQGDMKNLVAARISQTLSSDRTLQIDDRSQITYTVKSLDLTAQTATITVHFAGQAIYNVDVSHLASQLGGKNVSQANDIIRSQGNVQKVDITLAPTWQKRFPWFSKQISVTLGKV